MSTLSSRPDSANGPWQGRYSDPETAGSVPVELRLIPQGVSIEGLPAHASAVIWTYTSLHTDTPVQKSAVDVLLTSDAAPGATLFVDDAEFVNRIRQHAPQITTRSQRLRWARPALIAAAVLVVVGAALWFSNLKPARAIAKLMPQSARSAFGEKVVTYLAGKYELCVEPKGRASLQKVFERLLPDAEARKDFKVAAVDWSLVNAFAAPGGRIVLTHGLIKAAKSPEEVAGVLAHELGHGLELHPEAGIVRALGISTALDIMLGGSSGTLGSITGILIQTGYVREDERAADQQALRLMRNASVSQKGLADFFERIARTKGRIKKAPRAGKKSAPPTGAKQGDAKPDGKTTGSPLDLLRSHPQPGVRAAYVRATAPYPTRPILTDAEWQSLRKICSVKTKHRR